MQGWNKWPRWSEGLQADGGDAPQHETEPLTYNWRFPYDLWLAIAIDEEGQIALAIHPRDGILAGAFPQADGNGASPQPETFTTQSPKFRTRE
jgi:hypothetical protein